jgi:hypothetical protein
MSRDPDEQRFELVNRRQWQRAFVVMKREQVNLRFSATYEEGRRERPSARALNVSFSKGILPALPTKKGRLLGLFVLSAKT